MDVLATVGGAEAPATARTAKRWGATATGTTTMAAPRSSSYSHPTTKIIWSQRLFPHLSFCMCCSRRSIQTSEFPLYISSFWDIKGGFNLRFSLGADFFLLNFIFASKCYSEWYMLKSVWEWIEHNILPFGKSVSQHMYVMHQEVARRILCTVLYYVCACQTVYWILFASEKMLQMLLMLRTTVAGLRKGGVFMIILGVKFSLKKYV